MKAISDAVSLFRASHSPMAAGLFAVNMALTAARTKARIKRFPTTRFDINGVPFFANTWDGLLVLRPHHEPAVHAAVVGVAQAAGGRGIFVNVGAHIGRYALEFAKDFERTIAYEPTPSTFELLQRAAGEHPLKQRIEVRQACVGDRSGTVSFAMHGSESQNAVVPAGGTANGDPVIEVGMETLDSALSQADRARVKLLLVDVEGAEAMVLAGGMETLRSADLTLIIELLDDQAFQRCNSILAPLGYRSTRLDRTNYQFRKN